MTHHRRWVGKKRKISDDVEDTNHSSKRASKKEKIDTIVQQLRQIHEDKFTGPQLRLWARMRANGQHDDLDRPPAIPLFSGTTPNSQGG